MEDGIWKKVTIEEAEASHMVHDSRLGDKGVPFGFLKDQWKALVAQMVDGDELIEYSSPDDHWKSLCGRADISLYRNGEIIATILTRMS